MGMTIKTKDGVTITLPRDFSVVVTNENELRSFVKSNFLTLFSSIIVIAEERWGKIIKIPDLCFISNMRDVLGRLAYGVELETVASHFFKHGHHTSDRLKLVDILLCCEDDLSLWGLSLKETNIEVTTLKQVLYVPRNLHSERCLFRIYWALKHGNKEKYSLLHWGVAGKRRVCFYCGKPLVKNPTKEDVKEHKDCIRLLRRWMKECVDNWEIVTRRQTRIIKNPF